MAFQFNAILNFKAEGAVAGMDKAKRGFQQFQAGVSKANESFGQMMGGAQSGAIALAPLTAGFGLAINEAATFEKGLDAVQATLLATDEQMRPLSMLTKQLGAATKFSAFEATEGAKFLAQAGFDVNQIMTALPGVLSAAAAGEMELGVTADIVASTLGAFGLAAEKATDVADTLALGASLTNTDMLGLGEGLKYAAAQAAGAQISVQDTVSILGVLANAGLKGSMGGTSLANALQQLTKPSKDVLALFGGQDGLNAAIKDSTGQLLPFEVMMANVMKVTQNAADPLTAMGQAAEIFGMRGAKAFNAFAMQATATETVTDVMMQRFRLAGVDVEKLGIKVGGPIAKLEALRLQMNGAAGSAKQMADIQMGNFLGQLEQLSGAAEGLGIEIGSIMMGDLTGSAGQLTDAVSLLTSGFQLLNMTEEEATKLQTDMNDKNSLLFNRFAEFLPMVKEFAGGFKEGISGVIEGLKEGFVAVKDFFSSFSDSGMTAKEIGKMVAQVVLVGAMLAPVLAGIVAFAFVMGPIVSGVIGFFGFLSGIWGMVSGAFTMVIGAAEVLGVILGVSTGAVLGVAAAIIGIVALIIIFRKEIYEFGVAAYEAVIKFFRDPFALSFTEIGAQFGLFGKVVGTLLDIITFGFKATVVVIGAFAGFMYDLVVQPIITHWDTIKGVFMSGVDFVRDLFMNQLAPIFMDVVNAFVGVWSSIGQTFVDVGQSILTFWTVMWNDIVTIFTGPLDMVGANIQTFFTNAFGNAFNVVATTVEGFFNILKSVGAYMMEVLIAPFRAVLGFISQVVGRLAEFVPASLLETVGVSQADLLSLAKATTATATGPALPAPPSFGDMTTDVARTNARMNQDMMSQRTLAAPPSAEDISSVFSQQTQNQSTAAGGGGGQQTVRVVVEGKIRGNDLNLAMTRSQIDQSQQNGRSLQDYSKRKAVQNGQQFRGD